MDPNSKYKISVHPQNLVESNTTIEIRCNKVIVQNMSNRLVKLFRTFTLVPGASFVIGSEENEESLYCNMEITIDDTIFDSSKPDAKRVEILFMTRISAEASFEKTPQKNNLFTPKI